MCKQSDNIAARAELVQYPVDIKLQSIKYLLRCMQDDNNPLLSDKFSLSQSVHLSVFYSWYTYINKICNSNNVDTDQLKSINI